MKILVLGSSGFVGHKVLYELRQRGHKVYGTFCKNLPPNLSGMIQFDVDEGNKIKELLTEINPDVVISSLRGNFEKQAFVHSELVEWAQKCSGCRIIYISSLNVFDAPSMHIRAYTEQDTPCSESEYGNHKIQCERIIKEGLGENGIIIRIPFVYGKDCPRILELKRSSEIKTPVRTWDGMLSNVTTDVQIAKYVSYIIENDLTGMFHVGTIDFENYYGFQKRLAKELKITPVFQVEKQKMIFALASTREEIPEILKMTMEEALKVLTSKSNESIENQ